MQPVLNRQLISVPSLQFILFLFSWCLQTANNKYPLWLISLLQDKWRKHVWHDKHATCDTVEVACSNDTYAFPTRKLQKA